VIDILIPVLGRPERFLPLLENIYATTSVPFRIWQIISGGDRQSLITDHADGRIHTIVVGDRDDAHQYPRKINDGYRHSGDHEHYHPYIFNASDDLEFRPGWAMAALEQMANGFTHVVATNDQANSQVKKGLFGTHCLIYRPYIDQVGGSLDGPGTVFSEAYDHNFVDRELCHLAQHRGVYAYAKQSVVKHRHPLHDSHVRMDATYTKGLKNFHADQLLFFQRAAQWNYEGLNPQERRVARNRLAKR
jgi:hypothetical protein